MGLIKWFRLIKEEQVNIERHQKLILHNIHEQLKEIKALMELNAIRTAKRAK